MNNCLGEEIRKMPITEYLEQFDPRIRDEIAEKLERADVVGAMCFETKHLDANNIGCRTSVIFGEGCTYKRPIDMAQGHLGDVPSRFQYPINYTVK